ncbi:hypothetical protein FPV67DRAFT_1666820 [Lyophyllum atratum]|nr:hypothetical protein FPV67DRAFT_1666820 [Lyophyllum atratum]
MTLGVETAVVAAVLMVECSQQRVPTTSLFVDVYRVTFYRFRPVGTGPDRPVVCGCGPVFFRSFAVGATGPRKPTRVSLARAAYSKSDVVLLDGPLSAVDAYVGKAILDQCLLNGPLDDRTRILITHARHVLDKTDYIYTMDTASSPSRERTMWGLMGDSVVFSHLMEEYGSLDEEKEHDAKEREAGKGAKDEQEDGTSQKKPGAALVQAEEQNTGSVIWGAQVSNNLFSRCWTSGSIHGFRQGDHMAVYTGLGVAQAIFSFVLSFAFS